MGTYKTDWTDDTPAVSVHAQAHAALATGLKAVETQLASGGGAGASRVDLQYSYLGPLANGTIPAPLYIPSDFTLTYAVVLSGTRPVDPGIEIVLVVGNSQAFHATIAPGQLSASVEIDPFRNWGGAPSVPSTANGNSYLTVFNGGEQITGLTVAFGGTITS